MSVYPDSVRAVVVEDLALLRDGIVALLEAHGFDVIASLDSAAGLVERLIEERPDVSVVDIRLPPTHTDEGLRAAVEARRLVPGLPVVILSQYVEQLYARELLADGVGGVGYLLKDRVSNVEEFLDAVRRVASGGTALDPSVIAKLMTSKQRILPLDRLSTREREVLAQMAQGRSNAAIGAALVITEKAVGKHTASMRRGRGCGQLHSRSALVDGTDPAPAPFAQRPRTRSGSTAVAGPAHR